MLKLSCYYFSHQGSKEDPKCSRFQSFKVSVSYLKLVSHSDISPEADFSQSNSIISELTQSELEQEVIKKQTTVGTEPWTSQT